MTFVLVNQFQIYFHNSNQQPPPFEVAPFVASCTAALLSWAQSHVVAGAASTTKTKYAVSDCCG